MKKYLNQSLLIVFLFCLPFVIAAKITEPIDDEIQLVGAELFGVDQSHSHLGFSVEFLGMSTVKGLFNEYSVSILYNEEDMTKTSVTLIIDVTSIDTGNNWRDNDLQSERFFHAEEYPKIIFQSNKIEESDYGFNMHGDLTIRGVTQEIVVPFKQTLKRTVDIGWGNVRIGFAGTYTINRTDFGIHGGDFWGAKALSEEIEIEFGLLGTIMNMEKISFRSRDKMSIGEKLQGVIEEKGIDAAVYEYRVLKETKSEEYNFAENEMNKLGYKLLEQDKPKEALQIFRLNAEAYPESANVHDSMGEAYAVLGERQYSLSAYRKALEIEPFMPSAMEMVRRLDN